MLRIFLLFTILFLSLQAEEQIIVRDMVPAEKALYEPGYMIEEAARKRGEPDRKRYLSLQKTKERFYEKLRQRKEENTEIRYREQLAKATAAQQKLLQESGVRRSALLLESARKQEKTVQTWNQAQERNTRSYCQNSQSAARSFLEREEARRKHFLANQR